MDVTTSAVSGGRPRDTSPCPRSGYGRPTSPEVSSTVRRLSVLGSPVWWAPGVIPTYLCSGRTGRCGPWESGVVYYFYSKFTIRFLTPKIERL